jgi:hypothetical protein
MRVRACKVMIEPINGTLGKILYEQSEILNDQNQLVTSIHGVLLQCHCRRQDRNKL